MLEASCATVGVLLKNGDFVIPSFDRILSGTTAIKILSFLENEVIPKQITFSEGTSIKRVVRRDIKLTEIFENAAEVMILGGEQCTPVLEWDSIKISDKKGPATALF